ncbi:MAG: hypothetical protein M3072_07005 [Candidatus Dormibacteraeota bacterium]|nr:hypothetical protein [Candidatus Dormibacteraeota bacterium]
MSTTESNSGLRLTDLGNVPLAYVHEWRVAEPREPIRVTGAVVKWYHVRRESTKISGELDAEARSVLTAAAAGGSCSQEYGLNFALLHQSTTHAFLIAGVWRGHQELWERVYHKVLDPDGPFTRTDMSGEDAPVACVWELGVICHERMAWHRYLHSARDESAKWAWLSDSYSGRV